MPSFRATASLPVHAKLAPVFWINANPQTVQDKLCDIDSLCEDSCLG